MSISYRPERQFRAHISNPCARSHSAAAASPRSPVLLLLSFIVGKTNPDPTRVSAVRTGTAPDASERPSETARRARPDLRRTGRIDTLSAGPDSIRM